MSKLSEQIKAAEQEKLAFLAELVELFRKYRIQIDYDSDYYEGYIAANYMLDHDDETWGKHPYELQRAKTVHFYTDNPDVDDFIGEFKELRERLQSSAEH